MSSIDKLLIRGIRSFDPQSQSVIEFYSPLTIIVGPNGAGKTTIIECLQYATTGELPPNSKGGAFIFDPKLARETEVKAQIRLKFRNVNGRGMVVTRSLQLTQKRAKNEMKTLESLLVTKDPTSGEQVSLSSRCAELDTEIPLQLGVSKAILENVIFCHQEESLWPLAEPSILKKKFDDLFAATKYTKALEELKAIRKEKAAELKLDSQKVEFLKVDLEKAKRIQMNMDMTRTKITHVNKEIGQLEEEITHSNAHLQESLQVLEKWSLLKRETERAQHELSVSRLTMQELKENMTMMATESDESLEHMLATHSQSISLAKGSMDQLMEEKRKSTERLTQLTNEHSHQLTEKGLLQAQIKAMECKLEAKKKIEKDATLLLLATCMEPPLENAVGVETSLREQITRLEKELEADRQALRKDENEASAEWQALLSSKSSLSDLKQWKWNSINENKENMHTVNARFPEKDPEDKADLLVTEIHLAEEALSKIQTKTLDYEIRTRQLGNGKKAMDEEIQTWNMQLASLSKTMDMRAKMNLKKTERTQKEVQIKTFLSDMKTLFAQHIESTTSTTSTNMTLDEMVHAIDACFTANQAKSVELEQKKESLHQRWCSLLAKSDLSKSLKESKEREVESKQAKLFSMYGGGLSDFSLYFDQVEAEWKKDQKRMDPTRVYQQFLHQAKENHDCPLCLRGFPSLEEETSFIQSIETRLDSFSLQQELSSQARYEEATSARTLFYDPLIQLQVVELPQLTQVLSTYSFEMAQLSTELEITSTHLFLAKTNTESLSNLKRCASDLQRLIEEVRLLDLDMSLMELPHADAFPSIESIQTALSLAQSKSGSLTEELDRVIMESRALQHSLQSKELALMELRQRLKDLIQREAERQRLLTERTRLAQESLSLTLEINDLDARIASLDPKMENVKKKQTLLVSKHAQSQRILDSNLKAMTSCYASLVALTATDMATPSLPALQNTYTALLSSLTHIETEMRIVKAQLTEAESAMSVCNKRLAEIQVIQRNVTDNLRYRTMTFKVQLLVSSLQQTQAALADVGSHQALEQAYESHRSHRDQAQTALAGLLGERRQLEDQGARLACELSTDYNDMESRYADAYVTVRTTELLLVDLDVYGKALDTAIMKYHSLKMEELNKLIRELWVNTYQGSDIDTIEIRSDVQGVITGRQSYNYRVVMLKGGDIELDMRGRSSAGQRVLSSIIIRLALAEAFGLYCGILALDEPTTNLDSANMESLAESLSNIIKARRSQSNFQLIVITHDEEFVRLLGKSEFADYYWRVSRDENQHSIIERQVITANPTT